MKKTACTITPGDTIVGKGTVIRGPRTNRYSPGMVHFELRAGDRVICVRYLDTDPVEVER